MNIHTQHAGWGKNKYEHINKGKMTLVNENIKRTYKVSNGQIVEERIIEVDSSKTQIVYGEFRKTWDKGRLTSHYQYRRNVSLHGKGFEKATLSDFPGNLRQVYYNGGLQREKFIYSTGVTAYNIKRQSKEVEFKLKYPTGAIACKVVSDTYPLFNWAWNRRIISTIGAHLTEHWGNPIKAPNYDIEWWDDKEKLTFKGRIENRQKVGIWSERGKDVYYLQGVTVSEKVYSTPPEQLNVMEILEIENAQLRSALLSKYSTQGMFEKLRAEGVQAKELIEGDMKLITIPIFQNKLITREDRNRDEVLKFLEVVCPSTGAKYMLKVPPQTMTCEEGRQWTFGKDFRRQPQQMPGAPETMIIPKEEYIAFEQEV